VVTALWALLQSFSPGRLGVLARARKLIWFWAVVAFVHSCWPSVASRLSFSSFTPCRTPRPFAIRQILARVPWALLVIFAYAYQLLAAVI